MAAAPSPTAGTTSTSLRLCPPSGHSSFTSRSFGSTSGFANSMARNQRVVLCSLPNALQPTAAAATEDRFRNANTNRRDAMLQMAFPAVLHAANFAISSSPALALDDVTGDFRLYSDDVNKYKLSIPQEWEVGVGQTDGIRSITAFYPDKNASSNISVAITGIGADFTRLESFGKVDAFAESLVNGLDRSWQRPPGVAAKLIDCKAKNGLYYIEYTLQNPGDIRRHIYSAIGMARNEWYNRLYTVTGQYVDNEADKYSKKIEKAVQSFRLN